MVQAPGERAGRLRALLPGVLLSIVLPVLVYVLVRPRVHSDTVALVVGGGIAVLWTVVRFAWRRRVDPVGVIAMVLFAIAIVVSALSGGNSLPLKLQDSTLTGLLGLACLASLAVRRPLLGVLMRLLGRGGGSSGALTATSQRPLYVGTAIAGVTLLVHAIAHTVVALTLSTASYLVVSRLVGLPVYVAGGMVFGWYVRRRWGQLA